MIAHLRGVLVEKDIDAVVIDVGGVGYAVTVTANTMRELPPIDSPVRLFTYTHAVQDGGIQLYGFSDVDERRLFEAMLSVQGVGPKMAVAIVSGLPPPELVRAIAGADVARLTQIRGVGRKIAERLAVELREKVAGLGVGSGGRSVPGGAGTSRPSIVPPGRLGEVHAALIALGFRPVEFEAVLPGLEPTEPAPELIKQALAAMRKK